MANSYCLLVDTGMHSTNPEKNPKTPTTYNIKVGHESPYGQIGTKLQVKKPFHG